MNGHAPPGLRFGVDDEPGIRRHGHRRPTYTDDSSGKAVRNRKVLERIRALAVPPAWTDVWISADPRSHVQATGRDARGRKQYRYHPGFREHQEEAKFELARAASATPCPRCAERVERDLRRPGCPRDGGRGDRRAARADARPGRQRGVRPRERLVRADDAAEPPRARRRRPPALRFTGKSSKAVRRRARRPAPGPDRPALPGAARPAALPVRRRRRHAAPRRARPTSTTTCASTTGIDATAKTFRTWNATVFAAVALAAHPPPETAREGRSTVMEMLKVVAAELNNTPAVCRRSYVHPSAHRPLPRRRAR